MKERSKTAQTIPHQKKTIFENIELLLNLADIWNYKMYCFRKFETSPTLCTNFERDGSLRNA